MKVYTKQEEKATEAPEKEAESVAFSYALAHLQLHKIFNVHLQFQCCI